MDEQQKSNQRPVNPRRKPRSKLQIFKEAYLPVVIAAAALLLIIIFIAGAVARSNEQKRLEEEASIAASQQQASEAARLEAEVKTLLAQAAPMAEIYDYAGAIAILESFSGDIMDYPQLLDQIVAYEQAQKKMVLWDDPAKIPNLSMQLLVADTVRAYSHSVYGNSFRNNFITTAEFSNILEQLYAKGYMLVSLSDIVTVSSGPDGALTYAPKKLYLPAGKTPLLLTQTNVNYNIYLVDSDGDSLPDKNGCGFASKLVVDAQGNLTCEMVDSTGATVTGDFDMIPILEKFIAAHPDFSYRDARAILAVTGYNGLFGYRTNVSAKSIFGEDVYKQEVADVKKVIRALKNKGYEFACYTYENIGYGEYGTAQVQADLNKWLAEVPEFLGQVDIMVFAQNSDISSNKNAYSGEKYELLKSAGFTKFLGFSTDGAPWATLSAGQARLGRIMLTGKNLSSNAAWFAEMFDAATVLDPARG